MLDWILNRIAEFQYPSLKCERLGHQRRRVSRHLYRVPALTAPQAVADECFEIATVCRRCRVQLEPWTETSRTPVHSLPLGAARWRRLRETGELPVWPRHAL